ncbi:hypothetical protein [Paraburkholderia atlantica]|uniref:hypothetical protein n=1 Tax=Paraburkholderia atlantica TaxID=2654982 RepID=UPI00037B2600|nr:hypothetical protein [Paraburkholderia atlantica]
MTDREQYDAWLRDNFGADRVPHIATEFGFEAWKAGREALISASGAPVEIRVLEELG